MELLSKILNYVLVSFLHIWPYLLITIPIAVAVQLSGGLKISEPINSTQPICCHSTCHCDRGVQPVLLVWSNTGNSLAINRRHSACAGHVVLDCFALDGS